MALLFILKKYINMKKKINTEISFDDPVPESEIEKNEDGSLFIPIRIIEELLDSVSEKTWDRVNHKYSFHIDAAGDQSLATSFELKLIAFGGERTLLCSSFIRLKDYENNSNILQTGIAEATKAGVKVLGKRFGKDLNHSIQNKKEKVPIKRKPDAKVMSAYMNAIMNNHNEEITRLLSMYDIKTENNYAKS